MLVTDRGGREHDIDPESITEVEEVGKLPDGRQLIRVMTEAGPIELVGNNADAVMRSLGKQNS